MSKSTMIGGSGRRWEKGSGERHPVHRGIPGSGRRGGSPVARRAPVPRRSRSGRIVPPWPIRRRAKACGPFTAVPGEVRLYNRRKSRQIRSTSGNISPPPMQEQGGRRRGVPLPPRTAQQSPRNGGAPSRGCTTRRYPRNPSFAAHGSISERRGYGRMKANRPAAERNRDAAAKSSGSVHVASCRALSFPGSGFDALVPRGRTARFDTPGRNEPALPRGAPPENPRAGRAAVRPGNCRRNSGARNRADPPGDPRRCRQASRARGATGAGAGPRTPSPDRGRPRGSMERQTPRGSPSRSRSGTPAPAGG